MKVVKFFFVFAAAMLAITNVYSQNVDEIIDKYVNALGGIDKINGIQSMYKESDIEVMGNNTSSITYIINKKGFRMEMDF
jgi:nitrous oxide reductase